MDVAGEMVAVEWKRGPQTDVSSKVQNIPTPEGSIQLNQKFERISKFYYNSKMDIQPKLCEFKLITYTKQKPKVYTVKKFDMSKRINSKNKASVDLGKGVQLLIKMTFQPAHQTLHADLIKRDTRVLDDSEEEKDNTSTNPYLEANLASSELMGRTMSITGDQLLLNQLKSQIEQMMEEKISNQIAIS